MSRTRRRLKTVDEYYSGANNSIQHAAVRNIISSVVTSLQKDPARQFTYVEQAFFQRWWREQNNQTRDTTRALVKAGRLTFVNGGWCMHDEAATHYIGMVDQTTLGHRLLKEEFGEDGGVPTVGWQLDPFGHSATQAALLSADAGMDALFFGRIDYQDLKLRVNESRAEFVWRGSPSLGQDAQVLAGLTGSYGGNYGAPSGFNWDAVNGNDEPVELNPALRTYNEKARVDARFLVVGAQRGVELHGLVVAVHGVPVETGRGAVIAAVAARQPGQHLRVLAEGGRPPPHELRPRFVDAQLQVLVVDAAEEERVHARVGTQQRGLRRRVPERIQLPAHRRHAPVLAELLLQQPVAQRRLVHHPDVVRGGLVVHAPPPVDEGQPAGLDEGARGVPGLVVLLAPPALEEGLLHVRELARRVLLQRCHDAGDDVAHRGVLDAVVGTGVVLIDGLETSSCAGQGGR